MVQSRNRSTGALIIIMIALVVIGILIARSYYRNANSRVDPRIKEARELYARYNQVAASGDFYHLFSLIDSIENIYNSVKHYRNSFEKGVLYNNRAAALITLALYGDSVHRALNPYFSYPADSLMAMAERNITYSIDIYSTWKSRFGALPAEEIKTLIADEFGEAGNAEDGRDYLGSRSQEIARSLQETDRRLSVSYTNMGIVYRFREDYEGAARFYTRALELWDMNLEAENNLNRLLGRPLKKRNFIQRLFPPEK
ncbi:MAG: tetratricopeptide repeat protein [Marinilabiliaceae bacterium]|nr:tetratricopeptide repeat protein [Marinilabiliaceae bacterium]